MKNRRLKKILCAEDEDDLREILEMSLQGTGGLSVRACATGEETIAAVRDGFQPDLLLLDIMIPDMNGLQILAELRKLPATAKTPAVFITARAQPHELEEYKKAGASEILTKPFDPMALPEVLQKIYANLDDEPK
ncbi:MAG: response regulator [Leptospirales bacterium]|jgi:two-component system OmpR family response regulator